VGWAGPLSDGVPSAWCPVGALGGVSGWMSRFVAFLVRSGLGSVFGPADFWGSLVGLCWVSRCRRMVSPACAPGPGLVAGLSFWRGVGRSWAALPLLGTFPVLIGVSAVVFGVCGRCWFVWRYGVFWGAVVLYLWRVADLRFSVVRWRCFGGVRCVLDLLGDGRG